MIAFSEKRLTSGFRNKRRRWALALRDPDAHIVRAPNAAQGPWERVPVGRSITIESHWTL